MVLLKIRGLICRPRQRLLLHHFELKIELSDNLSKHHSNIISQSSRYQLAYASGYWLSFDNNKLCLCVIIKKRAVSEIIKRVHGEEYLMCGVLECAVAVIKGNPDFDDGIWLAYPAKFLHDFHEILHML